jgi:hypothetical protein
LEKNSPPDSRSTLDKKGGLVDQVQRRFDFSHHGMIHQGDYGSGWQHQIVRLSSCTVYVCKRPQIVCFGFKRYIDFPKQVGFEVTILIFCRLPQNMSKSLRSKAMSDVVTT